MYFINNIADPSNYTTYVWGQTGSSTGDLPNGELYVKPVYGWTAFESSSNDGNGLNTASKIVGGFGVASYPLSLSGGTFRINSGVNGSFSPKFYASGWKGGSPARITTYSAAKVGSRVSTGATAFTTGVAYYNIASGNAQPITYVDAGVGTAGLMSTLATYYSGAQIPIVGEVVVVYGTARLVWDTFYNLGIHYGPSKWFGTDNYRWFK